MKQNNDTRCSFIPVLFSIGTHWRQDVEVDEDVFLLGGRVDAEAGCCLALEEPNALNTSSFEGNPAVLDAVDGMGGRYGFGASSSIIISGDVGTGRCGGL